MTIEENSILDEDYDNLDDFDDFVTEQDLSKYYTVTFTLDDKVMQVYELSLLHDIVCILRESYFANCTIDSPEQLKLLNKFAFIKHKQRERILSIINSGGTEYSIKYSMLNYCSNVTDETDDNVMEFMLLNKYHDALNNISLTERALNEVLEFVLYPKNIKISIDFNYELYKKDLEE